MALNQLIEKLGVIRNKPQFLYNTDIELLGTLKVKIAIAQYKAAGYDLSEIDFIINSPGGSPDDAYKIIRALRSNFATVNVIVPYWAKSAATLLSLGANKIVMDEYGEFGPLDIQLGIMKDDGTGMQTESALNDEHSVARIETRFKEMYEAMFIRLYEHKKVNINKNELSIQIMTNLTKFYAPLLEQINPYKLGDKRRKLEIGEQYAKRILAQFHTLNNDLIRKIVDFLVNGCPDHSYIIDYAIMQPLLPKIVFKSEDFAGEEYSSILSQLSTLLILGKDREEATVGFVYNPFEKIEAEDVIKNEENNQEIPNFAPTKNSRNGKSAPKRKSTIKPNAN